MSTERTIEKIMEAFADAVAAGDMIEAESWIAVARLVADRAAVPTS